MANTGEPGWRELVDASRGDYCIAARNLTTSHSIEVSASQVVETASTIKLPILLALLDRVQRRTLSLRRSYRLTRADVGRNGSGIMQYMYLTNGMPLYNHAQLMMSVSDNATTNLIIRLLGKDEINRFIHERIGLKNTALKMGFVDFPDDYTFGPDNFMGTSTMADMATLMSRLVKGEVLDAKRTAIALRLMGQVQNSSVRRQTGDLGLRASASKTGAIWMDDEPRNVLTEVGTTVTRRGERLLFALHQTHPKDPRFNGSVDAAERVEFARVARALLIDLGAEPKTA